MSSLPLDPSHRPSSTRRDAARANGRGQPDLEQRIVEAERAVIERDERVQRRAQALVERGQRALQGAQDNVGRIASIGAAVGAGALVATRVLPYWRDHRHQASSRGLPHLRSSELPSSPARDDAQRTRGGHTRTEMPWASVLALAWPFMPRAVRAKVNPRLAAFALSLGLPLLARARPGAAPLARGGSLVRSAPHVDLQRFAGRWYEIARFPEATESPCASNVSANYLLRSSGEPVAVVNRCRRPDGAFVSVEGVARVMPRSNGSQLQVTFAPAALRWLPWVWADFWILRVDDDYRCALVGAPNRRHLWLLSRTPRLAGSDYQRLIEHAQAQGYDTERLTLTPQPRM